MLKKKCLELQYLDPVSLKQTLLNLLPPLLLQLLHLQHLLRPRLHPLLKPQPLPNPLQNHPKRPLRRQEILKSWWGKKRKTRVPKT